MTLLTLVQDAALRCNVQQPASAIGSSDTNVLKLVGYAQDAGRECARRWTWLSLKNAQTFTGNGVATLFPLADGFLSFSPSTTLLSSVYPTIPLTGPINEDTLQQLKALPYTSTPAVWRRIADSIEFYPALASGEIVSSVYAAKTWILSAGGVAYDPAVWMADTDVSLIDEELIRMGAIWMFKRSNGLDYAEEYNTYYDTLDMMAGEENQGRVINMTSHMTRNPETWFPGVITDLTGT